MAFAGFEEHGEATHLSLTDKLDLAEDTKMWLHCDSDNSDIPRQKERKRHGLIRLTAQIVHRINIGRFSCFTKGQRTLETASIKDRFAGRGYVEKQLRY